VSSPHPVVLAGEESLIQTSIISNQYVSAYIVSLEPFKTKKGHDLHKAFPSSLGFESVFPHIRSGV
jgi:hypothetical protein